MSMFVVLWCVARRLPTTSALGLLLLMAGMTVAHADELEEFTNRVGMDYKRIVLVAAEPYLCQGECVNDGLCQAFTYVKPQLEAQEAICYLKDGVSTL